MFLGELINFFIFAMRVIPQSWRNNHFRKLVDTADEQSLQFGATIYWQAFCGFLDSIGSTLQIVSLMLMPASISQMLGGGIVITTCVLSKFVLKRKIYRHNIFGCSITFCGFILVGIAGMVSTDNQAAYGTNGLLTGIAMVLIS